MSGQIVVADREQTFVFLSSWVQWYFSEVFVIDVTLSAKGNSSL